MFKYHYKSKSFFNFECNKQLLILNDLFYHNRTHRNEGGEKD